MKIWRLTQEQLTYIILTSIILGGSFFPIGQNLFNFLFKGEALDMNWSALLTFFAMALIIINIIQKVDREIHTFELFIPTSSITLFKAESQKIIHDITRLRENISEKVCIKIPPIRIRDDISLTECKYKLFANGVEFDSFLVESNENSSQIILKNLESSIKKYYGFS